MENLSYAQEYYLRAVNSKGDVPAMKSAEIHGSLLAGAVAQLLERGFVERGEGDALACAKPLDLLRNSISFARGPAICQPEGLQMAISAEALAKLKFRKSSIG